MKKKKITTNKLVWVMQKEFGKKLQIDTVKSENNYKMLSVAFWYFLGLSKASLPQTRRPFGPADLGHCVVLLERPVKFACRIPLPGVANAVNHFAILHGASPGRDCPFFHPITGEADILSCFTEHKIERFRDQVVCPASHNGSFWCTKIKK